MGNPQFLASVDSNALANVLRTVPIGAMISYDVLTNEIHRDVRSNARGVLSTARRIVLRDDHIVFSAVRKYGLKRLSDHELAVSGTETLHRIHRSARRGAAKLSCVSRFDELTIDERNKHNAAMSLLGVFYEITKTSGLRKIENAVGIMQSQLPLKETLQAFLFAHE